MLEQIVTNKGLEMASGADVEVDADVDVDPNVDFNADTNADLILEAFVHEHELVFIHFWAPWCTPCRQFTKVYEAVAHEFAMIHFMSINIEEEHHWSTRFSICSIPHLMIFKEGIVIYSDAGSLSESTVRELAHQALDSDVSEINHRLLNEV